MNIGITPRQAIVEGGEFLGNERRYFRYWKKYGFNLIQIPFDDNLEVLNFFKSNKIKGVIIAGGYSQYTSERRNFETKIISYAKDNKMPIIGVCCGMWTINAFFGGKLCDANSWHSRKSIRYIIPIIKEKLLGKKHIPSHRLRIVDLFESRYVIVNTYHKKSILRLADDLMPFAYADDNTVEGIYHPTLPIIAYQFHPEGKGCDPKFCDEIMKYTIKLFY